MIKLFDSHFHIIDPAYEMVTNQGFKPDFYTVENYLEDIRQSDIELVGGAVVSGSFQAEDQTYFEGALEKLGKNFVGITQLPEDISDEELIKLDDLGIKGIRFNLYRGLDRPLEVIEQQAHRVYDLLGWKTEFYLDLTKMDGRLEDLIIKLPAASIDHLGMNRVGFNKIDRLVQKGIPFRATGFGRIEYDRGKLLI